MNINTWHTYIHEGTAFFPTVAQTEAGFFLDIEPISMISATDRIAIEDAIKNVIAKGNPPAPAPDPFTKQKAAILKYTKVKTWKAFEKSALMFSIVKVDGIYKLKPQKHRKDRGWEADTERVEILPAGTTIEEVARLATERIVSEAQKPIES